MRGQRDESGTRDQQDTDWDHVEGIISDLKSDGYEPVEFESNTSHAAPSKRFFLKVER